MSRIASEIEDRARQNTWDGIASFADELDRVYAELNLRIAEYAARIG